MIRTLPPLPFRPPLPARPTLLAALGLGLAILFHTPAQAQAQAQAPTQAQASIQTQVQTQAPAAPGSETANTAPPGVAAGIGASGMRGRWLTESGNFEIEIAPCEGGVWCGTVVKVLANRSMRGPGEPLTNADPRPALGLVILSDLSAADDGSLEGSIYNRENSKHYRVRLSLDGPTQLLVRPYVGLPVFGKTQLWQRLPTAEGTPGTSATGTPAAMTTPSSARAVTTDGDRP